MEYCQLNGLQSDYSRCLFVRYLQCWFSCQMTIYVKWITIILSAVMDIVFAIGYKVRGFKIGRERLIFNGDKNP
jgi:hypothetical protein